MEKSRLLDELFRPLRKGGLRYSRGFFGAHRRAGSPKYATGFVECGGVRITSILILPCHFAANLSGENEFIELASLDAKCRMPTSRTLEKFCLGEIPNMV